MRENRLSGSMRGGVRKRGELTTAVGSIPSALARLLYLGPVLWGGVINMALLRSVRWRSWRQRG